VTRRAQLGVAVALAAVLLLLVVRRARGQAVATAGGPPRYVGSYDRLPSLLAELAARQAALDQATRALRPGTTLSPADQQAMAAIVTAARAKIAQLTAAVDAIHQAGQG
jgi:hypothetical protein